MICPQRRFPALFFFFAAFLGLNLCAQTDTTIFREFQFDFSTPGARANAMGRAFIGLADEATAAYNNPAGLSVLKKPEFSLEFRENQSQFEALKTALPFEITQVAPQDSVFDIQRVGFASFSFSKGPFNFSLFYVNNLDYRREPVSETVIIFNQELFYNASYINQHHVRQIRLDTSGISISKDFGRLDLGMGLGMAHLSLDFDYFTNLFVRPFSDPLRSGTDSESHKMSYVFSALYQAHPKLKIGASYKRQPKFGYSETVTNAEVSEELVPITFKVPDSLAIGIGYQPNDFWTILLDIDWIRYQQQIGSNMTPLSSINFSNISNINLQPEDFSINDAPEIHAGAEYLIPVNKNIWAIRFGSFLEPDHKTRFIGKTDNEVYQVIYDLQEFIFNPRNVDDELGYTLGLGFVWKGKLQWDLAFSKTQRTEKLVTSFLYRF